MVVDVQEDSKEEPETLRTDSSTGPDGQRLRSAVQAMDTAMVSEDENIPVRTNLAEMMGGQWRH